MIIKDTYLWSAWEGWVSVAVERSCAPDFERQGVAECAAENAENTAKFLGKLTELLFDKGVLTKDDVKILFGAQYEVVEAPHA